MGNSINTDKYVGIGLRGIIAPSIDANAAAFFAASGITGATQQAAIDNLVKGLKSDGLWSKMKAVYPFVTDNRNLLSYTEDFSNAYWGKQDSTVVINSTTAPNGTLTADKLTDNTVNSYHGIIMTDNINATSGVTYTSTIYAKYNGRNIQLTYDTGQFGAAQYANFDLQNGVLGTVLGGIATITSAGNGWYRCSFSRTATSTGTGNRIYTLLINSLSATRAQSFIGDTVSGAFIWGIQLEEGSTATTYQPIATTQQAYIASQFKYNLVNPVDSDAAFRLVFNGGWTHSSNGATPNGTNGYADTKCKITDANSGHLSFYSRTNSVFSSCSMGGVGSGGSQSAIFLTFAANQTYLRINSTGTTLPISTTNSLGYFVANRISSAGTRNFVQSSIIAQTDASIGVQNTNNYIGALSGSGSPNSYDNKQCAFSSIGDGLTDTEASNLYTRVQAYQTSLSRNI